MKGLFLSGYGIDREGIGTDTRAATAASSAWPTGTIEIHTTRTIRREWRWIQRRKIVTRDRARVYACAAATIIQRNWTDEIIVSERLWIGGDIAIGEWHVIAGHHRLRTPPLSLDAIIIIPRSQEAGTIGTHLPGEVAAHPCQIPRPSDDVAAMILRRNRSC